jgi:hypothetical protein
VEVDGPDPANVIVTVGHPFGDVDVPLSAWISRGPGPRSLVRPIRARRGGTGEPLPLAVVPLRYRNDAESRALIAAGALEPPPWHT